MYLFLDNNSATVIFSPDQFLAYIHSDSSLSHSDYHYHHEYIKFVMVYAFTQSHRLGCNFICIIVTS